MIISKVKKLDGTYLDHGKFESEAEAMAWFQPFIDKGIYGQKYLPAREVPPMLDENGMEIAPGYIVPEIPAEFTIEFAEVTQSPEEIKAAKIEAGRKARETCQKVLDYIAGENLDRALTLEEITVLQSTFSQAETALRAGRPTLAKLAISAISPDGELVTAEMKAEALSILADY